jgi:hypothetical protein
VKSLTTAFVFCAIVPISNCSSCSSSTPGTTVPPVGPGPAAYHSALYPPNWTPAYTDGGGGFLHDVSYAGYHRAELDIPSVTGPVFDVTDYGAVGNNSTDATAAFQDAIDDAGVDGGVVYVPAGTYRLDGLFVVDDDAVVIRGEGMSSRLNFTRTANMSDTGHLTFRGRNATGTPVDATADLANRGVTMQVGNTAGFAIGDDVEIGWVITPEFVAEHDMTGTWGAFNDTWQVFWQREIVDLTADTITLDVPHRYVGKVRDAVAVRTQSGYLRECGLESLALSNAHDGGEAEDNDHNHIVRMDYVADCWVRDVHTVHIDGDGGDHVQSGGIKLYRSKRVTIEDSSFRYAQNRLERGNGYLVEVSQVSDVLIEDVTATHGRHNFIQNWGFGATGVVWKDCYSSDSRACNGPLGWPCIGAYSEFHHSLAMANLIEGGLWDDGFKAENRGSYSSGAGFAATQNTFWNVGGSGRIFSDQFGWGYVIGAGDSIDVDTSPTIGSADGSPEDWVEGVPDDAVLTPASLYEDQLQRRLTP